MKRVLVQVIFVFYLFAPICALEASVFEGRVVVEWLRHEGSDRRMKLVEPFAFVDDKGKRWAVPEGKEIDGASIPPLFWNSIGPPFVGDYRYASVVHDYYCGIKTETWQATHRMFYDACVAAGVPSVKAKLMYAAVYGAGPRWRVITLRGLEGIERHTVPEPAPGMTDQKFEELRSRIEREDLSLDQIEADIQLESR